MVVIIEQIPQDKVTNTATVHISNLLVLTQGFPNCEPTSCELWAQKLLLGVYDIVSQQDCELQVSEPMGCSPTI